MNNMYNDTIKVIDEVKNISEQLELINKNIPSDSVTSALNELSHFSRELNDRLNTINVDNIIDVLNKLATQLNFSFKCVPDNNTYVFIIDSVYTYTYSKLQQTEQLIDFIKFVLKDYPQVQATNFTSNPVPVITLVTEVDSVKETEQTDEVVNSSNEHDWIISSSNDDVIIARNDTSVIKEPVRVSTEDYDMERKNNVEHLRTVKENIVSGVESTKQEKLKNRIGEIADGIGGTSLDVQSVRRYVEMWFNNMSNDGKFTLFELVDIIERQARVNDPMLIRLIIQTTIINYQQRLQNIPSFKEHDKSKNMYMQMSSIDKELLVGISVMNLDVIQDQAIGRPYGNYQLAIYLIDFCNKSSSLTVTESPEEIATLTLGVYNILLSKNLEGDFVYAADVNNQYDVYTDDWFKENNIISHYLGRIAAITEEDGQHDIIGIITSLVDKRDKTMTTPRIDTEDVNSVFDWANKLPDRETNSFKVHLGHAGDTYVVCGDYPVGVTDGVLEVKQAVIVITDNTAVAFVKPKNGGLTQEFYNPQHVNRLALWLNFFLPINNGEF